MRLVVSFVGLFLAALLVLPSAAEARPNGHRSVSSHHAQGRHKHKKHRKHRKHGRSKHRAHRATASHEL